MLDIRCSAFVLFPRVLKAAENGPLNPFSTLTPRGCRAQSLCTPWRRNMEAAVGNGGRMKSAIPRSRDPGKPARHPAPPGGGASRYRVRPPCRSSPYARDRRPFAIGDRTRATSQGGTRRFLAVSGGRRPWACMTDVIARRPVFGPTWRSRLSIPATRPEKTTAPAREPRSPGALIGLLRRCAPRNDRRGKGTSDTESSEEPTRITSTLKSIRFKCRGAFTAKLVDPLWSRVRSEVQRIETAGVPRI